MGTRNCISALRIYSSEAVRPGRAVPFSSTGSIEGPAHTLRAGILKPGGRTRPSSCSVLVGRSATWHLKLMHIKRTI